MSELLQELVEQTDILRVEADAMLAGIVLDTKNFTIRTGERTFDAAAFLRRAGADPIEVKKLFQNEMDKTMERYDILRQAKLYHGIAIAATEDMKDRVVAAQAADELLNISGFWLPSWLSPQTGVNVSARSIGDMNVQVLLEKLGGGGNKSAAGVQLKDISLRDAVNKIIRAIDEYQMG
jgi:c-di-AMP phosphodiesterase-like protein